MRYFCTYFDCHYLVRALALYESLKRHCPDFKIWMLCMDEESHATLVKLKLPEVSLLTLSDLERDDPPLRQAKTNRSLLEYYFTCTPSLPLFILRLEPTVDLITYLDADLFFFSTIEPLFEEMQAKSIAIIAHRFSDAFRKWEWNGKYIMTPSKIVIRNIFAPYLRQLLSHSARLGPSCSTLLGSVRKSADGLLRGCARLLKRQYLVVINGRII